MNSNASRLLSGTDDADADGAGDAAAADDADAEDADAEAEADAIVDDGASGLTLAYHSMQEQVEAFTDRPHLAPVLAKVVITVTNIGTRPAAHSALLFAQPPHSSMYASQSQPSYIPTYTGAGVLEFDSGGDGPAGGGTEEEVGVNGDTAPLQQLVGFGRMGDTKPLAPGEQRSIEVPLTAMHFAFAA